MIPRPRPLARTSFGLCLLLFISACSQESNVPGGAEDERTETTSPTSVEVAPEDAPFLDVTEAVGLDFTHFNGMSGEYYYSEMMGSGGALFDADADGDMDLFLVQGTMLGGKPLSEAIFPPDDPALLRDRLWLNEKTDNEAGFRFVEVPMPTDGDGYGMGVTAADFDGDGWTDLYVSQTGANRMLRHLGLGDDGRPRFEDITDEVTGSTRWTVPAAAFDADGDQDLDLFLGNYVTYNESLDRKCPDELGRPNYCGPLTYPPAVDQLLINVTEPGGPIRFEDRSSAAGITREFGACLGAVAADFNNDGRLDIYVANDGNPNQLWIAQGDGKYENQALLAGAGVNAQGHSEASMGVAVADVDGDRDEDIFLTHLARETHTLYVNDGQGGFADQSSESGIAGPSLDRTGFGTSFLDYDMDGQLDIVVAAGGVKVIKEQALAGDPHPLKQRDQLFRGLGDGRFEDVTDQAGAPFRPEAVGRGTLVGDLNNDGAPDLVLTYNAGPAKVLLNQASGSWLGLHLVNPTGTDVLGAVVELKTGDGQIVRSRVGANAGYASTNDPRLLFAFGTEPEADTLSVTVTWPDGTEDAWPSLTPGTYTTLVRGEGS